MTTKEKISAISEILFKKEALHLAQQKLADGLTIIEAEVFEAEQSIGIVTEDGVVPMPVGDYEMEDGMILVVAEEGIIAEIKEKPSEEEEVEADPAKEEEEMATEKREPKKIVESVSKESFYSKEDMEAKDVEITELKAKIEELTKVEEVEVELAEAIVHNPENKKEVKMNNYQSKQGETMLDRVLRKINN
jgi:hypothetical protein